MGQAVLAVRKLNKSYRRSFGSKPQRVVKDVSFEIQAGTVTGFLGANGAGKTTTIKCLLHLAHSDSGEIIYFGRPELTPEIKSRIGFLPERPYFYEYLSGREFLRFYGQLSTEMGRAALDSRVTSLLSRVGLAHAGDQALRSYSKGMLQRIGIAQALIHDPEFIILDEPMTGLDPDGRLEVRDIIKETAQQGTAVFFSSHLLPDAEQLCDQLVILKSGELVYGGATRDLLRKVDPGYTVAFTRQGHPDSLKVEGLPDLQQTIDRLRAEKAEILEIRSSRLTLEEAFIHLAFDRKRESR